MRHKEQLLERLCTEEVRVSLVAAHPDDEVIGAGAQMPRLPRMRLMHVTDGSPKALDDARRNGFDTRDEYARARRAELEQALSLAGIAADQAEQTGIVDQEASFHLVGLTRILASWFQTHTPEIVLTHPYEGGHPDHDAAAFAVYAACRMIERPPAVVEFTSYHAGPGGFERGLFLGKSVAERAVALGPEERSLKLRMMQCFVTQKGILEAFPHGEERFRVTPAYDFTAPPHEGKLHYENYQWGVTGRRWRELAASALHELGL